MGLNHTAYPLMNIYQSCEVVFSLEEKSENDIYSIWRKKIIPIKNIISKGHPILYPLKKRLSVIIILDVSCQMV